MDIIKVFFMTKCCNYTIILHSEPFCVRKKKTHMKLYS